MVDVKSGGFNLSARELIALSLVWSLVKRAREREGEPCQINFTTKHTSHVESHFFC